MLFVPVVSSSGKPLMPCHPARARELIRKGKAIRQFDRGLFFIRLTARSDGVTQDVVVGIDPGSKKEGITVKSEAHTYLNLQADAVTHVKEAKADQAASRRAAISQDAVSAAASESDERRSPAFHESQVAVEAPFAGLAASPVPDHTGRG